MLWMIWLFVFRCRSIFGMGFGVLFMVVVSIWVLLLIRCFMIFSLCRRWMSLGFIFIVFIIWGCYMVVERIFFFILRFLRRFGKRFCCFCFGSRCWIIFRLYFIMGFIFGRRSC